MTESLDIRIKHQHGDTVLGDKVLGNKYVGYTIEQVSTLLAQIRATFQPKPFDGRCPYLGLDAFTEDDADRFFGRERLVAELLERVKSSRFVIIAGPSGSGKSSLVRAGLIHALKQGALPNSDRWLYATLTPGRDPIEALALAMSRLAKSPEAGKYLREHSAETTALHEFVEAQLSDCPDQRAVIFVDQFEEVFTPASQENKRIAFLNLLIHAATTKGGRVTVLFALRSDFVTNCSKYPLLNALLNQQFMQVGAMQPDELVSASARPALQVGLRIDPDLITQIGNDMQDEPGALPLMQFALKDLFDTQQAKGGVIALTLDDYLARGGLRKALERHADAAFAQLSKSEQHLAQTIFSGLIEIGRGTPDTRRTATLDGLPLATVDATQVKAVVQKLADARLITTDERDGKETFTIAHETLFTAWPWLRKLIDGNRESIALQNKIAGDAEEWHDNKRAARYLYPGARLATAREQLAAKKIVLNEQAQAFVEAGIQAERRRAAYLIGLLLIAVVAAVIAALSGFESQRQARISLSRQLAAQSISHVDNQFDLALLLSIESRVVDDTVEARNSLLTGLERHPGLTTFLHGHSERVQSVAFSPDGKTLASGSFDKTIILWDVSNPKAPKKLGAPLTGHTDVVYSVAFSPDGKTLASGSRDKTIILWDVSNRRQLGIPLTGHTDTVNRVAFSPAGRGKTLASGSFDKTIILWDVSNPKAPKKLGAPLSGHGSTVWSVAFSQDGKTLASGSEDKTIILWDVSNPKAPVQLVAPLSGHGSIVTSVAFSPAGRGKTLASGSTDKTIILWDVSNLTKSPVQLGVPLTDTGGVNSVAFSPDGQTLASGGGDKKIILWDVSNRQSPGQLGTPLTGYSDTVSSVAFSPDGKTLASGSYDKMISLWNVSNPKAPKKLGAPFSGHGDYAYSVAFSPDGKMLASGSSGSYDMIILWNVSNPQLPGQLGAPLTGHALEVYSVAFSPDGKMLASGSGDKTIILWDVSNPKTPVQLGAPLNGHTDWVNSVAFSPDGKTLTSGSVDKTIILWDVDPVSWRERACQIAHRNLTPTEWGQYLGDEPYRQTCEQWPAGGG